MSKRAKLGLLIRLAILLILGLLLTLVYLVEAGHKETNQVKQEKDKQFEQLEKENQKLKILHDLKIKEAAKPQPQPTPQPKIAVVSPVGSCEQYRPIVEKYSWSTAAAMLIMDVESEGGLIPNGNCDPNAISPTNDHGLFQIHNGLALYGQQIYEPAFNTSIAYNVKYLHGGFSHWTTCKNGVIKCW